MTATVFVDTNVLLYAVDNGDLVKQSQAQQWRNELWRTKSGRTSFQVLQEFYANVRNQSVGARQQARADIRDLLEWGPVRTDGPVLELAWHIQDRYKSSFWDALIIAAAKTAGCRYLLTEDLQSGQDFDGLTVVNPFQRDFQSLDIP